jgi:cell division protein FtsB
MSDLESLALLIADLNAQVRALQAENRDLREQIEDAPND